MNNWRNHLIAERTQLSRLIEQLPQASVIERMSLEARVGEIDAELKGMGDSQPVAIAPCAKCGGKGKVKRVYLSQLLVVVCETCGEVSEKASYRNKAVRLWNKQQGADK